MRCKSGRHEWADATSARRCCDPAWRRELRIGSVEPDDDPDGVVHVDGEAMWFVWARRSPVGDEAVR